MTVYFRQQKDRGVFYTPESTPLISFLCQHTIFPCLVDMINDVAHSNYQLTGIDFLTALDTMPDPHLEQLYEIIRDIKILDPSVGSGSFLLEVLRTLGRIYTRLVEKEVCDLHPFQINEHILKHNLFGVDISETAVKTCIKRLSMNMGTTLDGNKVELMRIPLEERIRVGNALMGTSGQEMSRSEDVIDWFDWQVEFPTVFARGGFDLAIGNPPWNILKPLAKEFFSAFDPRLTKYSVDKITARKIIQDLLTRKDIQEQWRKYRVNIQEQATFFRSDEYRHQSGQLNVLGRIKTVSGDFNLYKLFLERYYKLTRPGGYCGVIVPSGLHTDAGTKGLRELLFEHSTVKELHCFENRRGIFPTIHRSFKFDILVFKKQGNTKTFRTSFMLQDAQTLTRLHHSSQVLDWQKIKHFSPSSWSIMELKTPLDLEITECMYKHPPLGQDINGSWTFRLKRELDITLDSHLFNVTKNGISVYEGKMIEMYTHLFKEPRYWITNEALISKFGSQYQDYLEPRLAFRAVAASTNRRTMIATVLPKTSVCGNSLILTKIFADEDNKRRLLLPSDVHYLTGVFNSFVFDYLLRLKVSQNLNMFFIYDMPVPRVPRNDSYYRKIIQSVTTLVRNTSKGFPLTSSPSRARHFALVDSLVAHLYNLSLAQFDYILDQFHLKNNKKEQLLAKQKTLTRQCFQGLLSS